MIKLSPLFSDYMVVQRDLPFVVSGVASPGAMVKARFGKASGASQADENGSFSIELGSFPADSEPRELWIAAEDAEVTIREVVVGDVWLLSGQSNMELWLRRTAHNYPEVMEQRDPLLRQFAVPQGPELAGPLPPWEMPASKWRPFTKRNAPDFSAVGYFFAAALRRRFSVPIGVIAAAVGGTPIAAWLPKQVLEAQHFDLSALETYCAPGALEELVQSQTSQMETYQEAFHQGDPGLVQNWAAADFDDSKWETRTLTDFAPGTGSHWYRKTLAVPPEMAERKAEIFLGTAIDMDEVFSNGEKIGTTYYRYPPRVYPFIMPEGFVTIAIRLLTFGQGGEFTLGKNHFIATNTGTISLEGPWKYHVGAKVSELAPAHTAVNNLPTGLYNSMIAPLRDLKIRGVAWYQGESDTGNPSQYGQNLKALIRSWRELFLEPELPFVIQQLAHWDHTGPGGSDAAHHRRWEELRQAQLQALQLPNVGVASGYDVGEFNDLHPQGKQIVGERLARLARRLAYGELLPPNMFEQYRLATPTD
jgi:sialate O-acetylesterase